MNNKKSMIAGIVIGIIALVVGGCYFLVTKCDKNEKDSNTAKSTSFVLEYLEQGNSLFSYRQDIVLNNVKELNLKQGEYINIYLTGKDIDKQELILSTALVGYDYESSSNSVVFFAPEEMFFKLKCVEYISGEDYMVKIERVDNEGETVPKLGDNINKILDGKCENVEQGIVEDEVKIEID